MKRFHLVSTMALLSCTLGAPVIAGAEPLFTRLSGFEEVPPVATEASGNFLADINDDNGDGTIEYALAYEDLESDVLMAHIHLGQPGVNGGIIAWLCTTENAPAEAPEGTPICPQEGVVTGTIRAEDVVGPENQALDRGDMEELIQAIRLGVTYANVHTEDFPNGEIRGQIR
ncbi:MAG TPA: CHRD domain-containing protein [Candidatus Sulfotelmatobacter sp.]|nr:CHRD domain-containing protein [Candidatus Sulfotelmatobacter sp.]